MALNPQEHQSITLRSVEASIETPSTDIIVAGGPSSSEILNDLRQSVIDDTAELDRRTQDVASQIGLLASVFNTQLQAMETAFQAANAQLPATNGNWLAEFFSNDFIDGSNTAEISRTYGQATLPILTEQEKLVGRDSRDRVWIPNGAQVNYSYKTTTPDEVDWLTDENTLYALDQKNSTAWWRERPASGTVWVRFRIPVNLNANKFANAIILHPYPVLTFDLISVEYRNPAGVWTAADLTYLENWDGSKVASFGNVRIFTPQTQMTEVRVKLNAADFWGFSKLSVKQIEFAPAATLVVSYASFSPNTIDTVNLNGKDPDALSFIQTQVSGAAPNLLVSAALTQNSQNASPVITAIEAIGS